MTENRITSVDEANMETVVQMLIDKTGMSSGKAFDTISYAVELAKEVIEYTKRRHDERMKIWPVPISELHALHRMFEELSNSFGDLRNQALEELNEPICPCPKCELERRVGRLTDDEAVSFKLLFLGMAVGVTDLGRQRGYQIVVDMFEERGQKVSIEEVKTMFDKTEKFNGK